MGEDGQGARVVGGVEAGVVLEAADEGVEAAGDLVGVGAGDDDGLSDGTEVTADYTAGGSSNPNDPDTDDDGLCDGPGPPPEGCTGGEDQNGNGLVDEGETDPTDPDTDDDGLGDGQEVNEDNGIPVTDPLDPDTDDGGVLDGAEVLNGTNPADAPYDDYGRAEVKGNGLTCSGGGSGGAPMSVVLVLAGLLLARVRRSRSATAGALALLVALGTMTTIAPSAHAAGPEGVATDHFLIKPGHDRVFSVRGAEVAPAWSPYGGLWVHYVDDPLRLVWQDDTGAAIAEQRLVRNRTSLVAGVGIGLFDLAELELWLPVVLDANGDESALPGVGAAGVGDIGAQLRFNILSREDFAGFGLTVGVAATFPSGKQDAAVGDGGAVIMPRIDAAYTAGPVLVALNLETRFGHELDYGLGVAWLAHEYVTVGAEIFGSFLPEDAFADEESPMEWAGGVKVHPIPGLTVEAGAGTGIIAGYGAPDWRIFTGVQWAEPTDGPRDRDEDGILDDVDACPDVPEDIDQFEDLDGCPDPDNDQDGILDVDDACPMDPEDFDSFQDTDGCPDPDNDGDEVLDVDDRCPMEPEDQDGFEDADGCPDPDNDQDGVLDTRDACPLEPETMNSFEDTDGCPDELPEAPPAVEEPPAEPRRAVMKDCKIEIRDKVYFKTAKARILKISYPLLDDVAQVMLEADSIERIEIQGHTDDRGSASYNKKLSDKRAAAVLNYLVMRGVPQELLTSRGYGEDAPVASNDSDEGRQKNRRVTFVAIGGECPQ